MKHILIAEDDPAGRRLLEGLLARWGYQVTAVADGLQAWDTFQQQPPPLAILDWGMPGLDGIELCRRLSQLPSPPYLILLTGRDSQVDIVTGLEAGANDYLTKPFEQTELRARVEVGFRVLELQHKLADKVAELEDALEHVKVLQDILPICMYCHNIRNDQESWERIEQYMSTHAGVQFSHGICPDCMAKHYPEIPAQGRDAPRSP